MAVFLSIVVYRIFLVITSVEKLAFIFSIICCNPAVFRKEMAIKNRKGKVRE